MVLISILFNLYFLFIL
jgi:calcium/calmodulin-dependent serine protein kinase